MITSMGLNMTRNVGLNMTLNMASLLDCVPYSPMNFILNRDVECGIRGGFHLILNVGINMTTNVGMNMTRNVGLNMTLNYPQINPK